MSECGVEEILSIGQSLSRCLRSPIYKLESMVDLSGCKGYLYQLEIGCS